MTHLAKLNFPSFTPNEENYLIWALDAKLYLQVHNLVKKIEELSLEISTGHHDAQGLVIMCHHLNATL